MKVIFPFFFLLFMASASLGATEGRFPSIVQLVQSVPLETDLAQTGISNTTQVWLEMIKKAKSTIDLAQFYVSSDSRPRTDKKATLLEAKPMEVILSELEKASQRGVSIRLLLSHSLLQEDPPTLERLKRIPGLTLRIFDMARFTGGVMHAKYWIVDRKEVFLGSQNFDWRALLHDHELGVRVQDLEVARRLSQVFDFDWKLAKADQMPEQDESFNLAFNFVKPASIELYASPPRLNPSGIRSSLQAILELLSSAKKSIRVQLLDYSPVSGSTASGGQTYWPDLDNAIRAAALRGVKVQMLVSDGPTVVRAVNYLKSLSLVPGVEIKKVTIPAYSGGHIPYARTIHSKYMVVDESTLWIGTSNWSKGYFENSRNIELVIKRPELAKSSEQIFQKLWDSKYSEKLIAN